jgi:two-component system, LytTR family, response regulator
MIERLSAAIIDDEPSSRKNLFSCLTIWCPRIKVIAEADDCASAIKIINDTTPAIIFLDIQMPDGNALNIIEQFPGSCQIIFVTAFDQYAVTAFKKAPVDYLLKPIDHNQLITAVDRAITRVQEKNILTNLEFSQLNSNENNTNQKFLKVAHKDQYELINIDQILHIRSDNYYSEIYFLNNRKSFSSVHLKNYEKELLKHNFFRIHNSHLVNLKYVTKVHSKENLAEIFDGSLIPISRRKKSSFSKSLLQYQLAI